MKLRSMIAATALVLALPTSMVAYGSVTGESPIVFPVKWMFGDKPVTLGDEYETLYYNGHIYAPVRWLAERVYYFNVDYDASSRTVSISEPLGPVGPKVTPDQAKIVAYEQYHLRHVDDEFSIRGLSDEEWKQVPPDAKKLTPVYYFVTGTKEDGEQVTICVSSNNKEHSFVYEPEADLQQEFQKIAEYDDVFRQYSVQVMSMWTENSTLILQLRKLHRHREALTETETAELKSAIYQAYGSSFPLVIQSFTISDNPDIAGEIKTVDKERQRILVVYSKDKVPNGEPDAAWLTLAEDTAIVRQSTGTKLSFGELSAGLKVSAWSDRMWLTSYPGQVTVLEITIE
ncbi:hypothetical protein ACFFK0_29290 [Paenibacillus chartarius]|uniref:Copper amine oxidase-like N-terminal domain-containing protein n=1 Tax=Paenibacillus chartarius TaxID=747481 RepID=A0ABV6DV26_9BACL